MIRENQNVNMAEIGLHKDVKRHLSRREQFMLAAGGVVLVGVLLHQLVVDPFLSRTLPDVTCEHEIATPSAATRNEKLSATHPLETKKMPLR